MDPNNDMNMNAPRQESQQPPQQNGSSAGPIIGVIVILAIIILGGLYFWSQRANNDVNVEGIIEEIDTQSEADDTSSIEVDLDATDIENLDAELNAS